MNNRKKTTAGCADYQCSFARGAWNPGDWLIIKEPRFAKAGEWIQEDNCIRNRVPDDASKADLLDTGKRANETFTTMILKGRMYGDVEIRSKMSFEDRMAPLIVLRAGLGLNADGVAENLDMYNAVIFDEGIRIWQTGMRILSPASSPGGRPLSVVFGFYPI